MYFDPDFDDVKDNIPFYIKRNTSDRFNIIVKVDNEINPLIALGTHREDIENLFIKEFFEKSSFTLMIDSTFNVHNLKQPSYIINSRINQKLRFYRQSKN